MQRGVFDLLRRGFDNTIANWQLSLIRFLEAFLFIALAIGAAIAILMPILLSVGIQLTDLDSPDEIESAMAALLSKWMMLLWIVVGVTLLLLVFMLVHSFVEAGCARVLSDGDRVAGPEVMGERSRYRVFSIERWMTGGKQGWWTVFWIYNAIWAVAGLVMLIPLVPTVLLIFLFRHEEGVAVLTGCLGLIVSILFMFVVAVVAALWSNRAIVTWAIHHTGVAESMRIASAAIKRDLGRHVLVALALIVVAMAGSMLFSSFSFFAGMGEAMGGGETFLIMTLPLRLLGSLLNSAFSAVLGSWYLASYAALALDPVRR
jgi:hypothetical protein